MMSKSIDRIKELRLEEKNDKRFALVKVNIPGGFLCGKWWGPKNVRPILCIHGWMDNCGSFDALIPLLPKEYSYLALDLPGHGISSRYANGMIYSYYDTVVLIERIRREYEWDKISLMGHSLGGLCSFFYSSMFSEKIDFIVALDTFFPYISDPCLLMRVNLQDLLKEDQRMLGSYQSEPPSYEYDELLDKIVTGSSNSVDRESAKYLLTRGVKRSSKFPGKYFFNYDRRLKGFDRTSRDKADLMHFAKHISCPVFHALGNDSYMVPRSFKNTDSVREYLLENNPNFEVKFGPGEHHFLLTHPAHYADYIGRFMRKHRPIKAKL